MLLAVGATKGEGTMGREEEALGDPGERAIYTVHDWPGGNNLVNHVLISRRGSNSTLPHAHFAGDRRQVVGDRQY